jgi:hypothetical protein
MARVDEYINRFPYIALEGDRELRADLREIWNALKQRESEVK